MFGSSKNSSIFWVAERKNLLLQSRKYSILSKGTSGMIRTILHMSKYTASPFHVDIGRFFTGEEIVILQNHTVRVPNDYPELKTEKKKQLKA